MSLINQMLQNLEKRGGDTDESAGLPPEVRVSPVVPASANRNRALILTLGLGLAVGAAVLLLPWNFSPVAQPQPSLVPPPVPPVTQAPVAEVVQLTPQASVAVAAPSVEASVVGEPVLSSSMTLSAPVVAMPPKPKLETIVATVPKETARLASGPAEKVETPPTPLPSKPRAGEAPASRSAGIAKTVPLEDGDDVAERIYRQALDAYSQGRTSDSLALVRQAITASPPHQAARQLLVRQYIEQRDLGQACAVLRDGIRILPGQLAWQAWLARLEMERGDLPAARQVVEEALVQAGNNADMQALAGAIAQRQGRSADAAEHYRAALRLKPAEGRSWVGLGLALEAEGHGQEAREAFRRALNSPGLGPELQGLAQRKLR